MLALPIFPGRLQPSIVGRSELNFRVRDGNGWTLALISTNFVDTSSVSLFAVSIPRFAHSAVSPLSITNASLVCDGSLIVFTYTLKTEQCSVMRWEKADCLQNFCRSSPRAISTGQLHTLLHFHLRPINQIVFLGPYSIKDERSYLRESFTLRCFQRLSRPYLATQLCPWQNNWCTRGTSIPVLSY